MNNAVVGKKRVICITSADLSDNTESATSLAAQVFLSFDFKN